MEGISDKTTAASRVKPVLTVKEFISQCQQ
jgi:hypothetical protein